MFCGLIGGAIQYHALHIYLYTLSTYLLTAIVPHNYPNEGEVRVKEIKQ
jgi:hypothetical protein